MARSLWRGGYSFDRSFRVDPTGWSDPLLAAPSSARVIGVVRDAVSGWIGDSVHRPIVYLPIALATPGARILVRADGPSERTRRTLERELGSIDPAAVDQVHTLEESVAFSVWPFRINFFNPTRPYGTTRLIDVSITVERVEAG